MEELNKFEKFELYDEEDGFGFCINDLWFGVDYNLWRNDTLLVLESSNEEYLKTINNKKPQLIPKDDKNEKDWFYIPLKGNKEEMIELIKKLLKVK